MLEKFILWIKGKKNDDYIGMFLRIGLIIVVCTILYTIVVFLFYCGESTKIGEFGDLFGGLNALFSGLAFAGVIITILMQMQELKENREVMKASVKEQKESQEALNKQLESMRISSRIDAFSSYMNNTKGTDDNDKYEIAKKALKLLTEEMFTDEKFEPILRPNIEFLKFEPIYEKDIVIKLVNKGGSFFIKDFRIYENEQVNDLDFKIIRSGGRRDLNSIDEFQEFKNEDLPKIGLRNLEGNFNLNIDFILKSSVIDYYWSFKLKIWRDKSTELLQSTNQYKFLKNYNQNSEN